MTGSSIARASSSTVGEDALRRMLTPRLIMCIRRQLELIFEGLRP
jgi:hypothetical protein